MCILNTKLYQKLQQFCWMGGFFLLVEMHREGSVRSLWDGLFFFFRFMNQYGISKKQDIHVIKGYDGFNLYNLHGSQCRPLQYILFEKNVWRIKRYCIKFFSVSNFLGGKSQYEKDILHDGSCHCWLSWKKYALKSSETAKLYFISINPMLFKISPKIGECDQN